MLVLVPPLAKTNSLSVIIKSVLKDLTVIILAHNEADNLRQLLPSLSWVGKIIIIDDNSSDNTKQIARQFGALCLTTNKTSFAQKRNQALAKVTTTWLLYLDADERPTPALRDEVIKLIGSHVPSDISAFALRRQNYCYGKPLYYGGWQNDWVTRLFKTKALRYWQGDIHESPVFQGEVSKLQEPLWHFTHRRTSANLAKSSAWTIKEATLLAQAKIPPVTKWTVLRKTLAEFYRRYFFYQGYRDGMAGFVESYTQACNRGFVYIQVWELQQCPSIEESYQQLENALKKAHKK